MQNVHQMQTKLMNILHGECSSEGDMCNSIDAIASKYFTYIQNYNCPATLDSSDQLSEGVDWKPFYLVSKYQNMYILVT